ncbi:MAG TPA: peptidoglycan editing factor PgeF [Candidatus Gracilibacteria bacterium]|nr:peptidoglycan editing factor PgeF [Candidatus Gracilibacteria bacterium]
MFNENLSFGISEKKDGDMRLFIQDPTRNFSNRKIFFEKQGLNIQNCVMPELIHQTGIDLVGPQHKGLILEKTDALITHHPGIILALTVADCMPVYFYDPVQKVIGLVHAGWRGIVNQIIPLTIQKLIDEYHINPQNLEILVGPHLQKCHFEIQNDILPYFRKYSPQISHENDKIMVDLNEIVLEQLKSYGITKLEISPTCTFCENDHFFSYRREQPVLETMMAYMVLKH